MVEGKPRAVQRRNVGATTTIRQRVVVPIFATLTSCDGLVVLVDIANILASGPSHLNDAHFFMDQMLKASSRVARFSGALEQTRPTSAHPANRGRRIPVRPLSSG